MEYHTLIKQSNHVEDKPIAIIKDGKNTLIEMHKTHNKTKIVKEINTEADIFPITHKDKDQNIRIYIAGQTGCGKSYIASKILENYVRIYPNQRIIIFSALDGDKCYDDNPRLKHKISRILIDQQEFGEISKICEEDLRNSICVFDDFKTSGKLEKIINDLKNCILRRGRHYEIDSIIITDKLLGSVKTISELTHCNYIVFFPICINAREIKGLFDNYLGIDKSLISKFMNLNSRWVMISKLYPRYCVSQHSTFLL
jgi:hypothetical protein